MPTRHSNTNRRSSPTRRADGDGNGEERAAWRASLLRGEGVDVLDAFREWRAGTVLSCVWGDTPRSSYAHVAYDHFSTRYDPPPPPPLR